MRSSEPATAPSRPPWRPLARAGSIRLSRDPAARRRLAALVAVAAIALLAGIAAGAGGGGGAPVEERSAPAADRRQARSAAARLPLEAQVGQLLMMAFDGPSVPEYIRRRLARSEGTGVILFGPNVVDARSVRAVTDELQRSAGGSALVATDQEGGEIRNLPFAAPEASPATLADAGAAGAAARDGARDLRAAGVNVNLAPVADVASDPASVLAGRAYPGGADKVAQLTTAAVEAHARERVGATVKHFPGLGGATVNTDDGSATIEDSREALEAAALPPFRAAVRADAPLVMASHALYPALDPDAIASQSRPILVELLRRQLGFGGVVITDSIEAQAVLDRSDVATAAERSVAAGSDIVLMTGSGSWNLVYPRLLARARRDPSFRALVVDAAARVLALKRRLGLTAPRGQ